ncbi:hypothetical protein KKG81_04440 [bacterium]|jgi:hypothetical protein|nr:hypothetical protein [bacterium]
MKIHSSSLIFILTLITISSVYSKENNLETNIDSILKIKPEINYSENLKYQEINKYKESKNKEIKSHYDFGFNLDVNKEERTIEGIKIDVGTNF